MTNFTYNARLNKFIKFPTRRELTNELIAESLEWTAHPKPIQYNEFRVGDVWGRLTLSGNYLIVSRRNSGFLWAWYCKPSGEILRTVDWPMNEVEYSDEWGVEWVLMNGFKPYEPIGRLFAKFKLWDNVIDTPMIEVEDYVYRCLPNDDINSIREAIRIAQRDHFDGSWGGYYIKLVEVCKYLKQDIIFKLADLLLEWNEITQTDEEPYFSADYEFTIHDYSFAIK